MNADTIIGATILVVALAWWLIAGIRNATRDREAMIAAALEQQAADHNEPSRAAVELDWTFGGRLPSPDASDEEIDDWARAVIDMRQFQHPSMTCVREAFERTADEIRRLPEVAS